MSTRSNPRKQRKADGCHPYFCGKSLQERALQFTAWRISRPEHGKASPNGTGAHRWNSPGMPIIYAAESRALAALEMLGHLEGRDLFGNYVLIPISIEHSLVQTANTSELPGNWRSDPPPLQLRRIGDEWLERAECPVLQVPSALVPEEHNFLLNTRHPDFPQLGFGDAVPFRFDPCLIKNA